MLSMAPMEGITGYVYRRAFASCFQGIDRFYTPFIATNQNRVMKGREKRDVFPENNQNIHLIPQLLSANATDTIVMARQLKEMGYNEINLNFGCPYPTVVTKGKGAGILKNPENVKIFLDKVFKADGIPSISVKTRLGVEDPREFEGLLKIYKAFPLEELVIHPRVQKDLYHHSARKEILAAFDFSCLPWPVQYNGDIIDRAGVLEISRAFPVANGFMLGRGLLTNPFLGEEILGICPPKDRLQRFVAFHEAILAGYMQEMKEERQILFKLKELWQYWILAFPEGEKWGKAIRKATGITSYQEAVQHLTSSCSYCPS